MAAGVRPHQADYETLFSATLVEPTVLEGFSDDHDVVPEDASRNSSCRAFVKAALDATQDGDGPKYAIYVQYGIVVVIVASTGMMVMETVPELHDAWPNVFDVFERFFTVFFTVEITLRIWAADDRCALLMSPWCMVDMMAVFPCYIEAGLSSLENAHKEAWSVLPLKERMANSFVSLRLVRLIRLIRLIRIMRLAKAARHSEVMTVVLDSIGESVQGILTMIGLMFTLVIFSATVMFWLESEIVDTHFTSIPAAMWWALPTVTGVGYGDWLPQTVPGRVCAAATITIGFVIVAVSSALITTSFIDHFQRKSQMMRLQRAGIASFGATGVTIDKQVDRVEKQVEQLLNDLEGMVSRKFNNGKSGSRSFSRKLSFADTEDGGLALGAFQLCRVQSKVWFKHLRDVMEQVLGERSRLEAAELTEEDGENRVDL